MQAVFLFLILLSHSILVAVEVNAPEGELGLPWLTGTIIAPSPTVVPKGRVSVQPYIFVSVTNGFYDEHWHASSAPAFTTVNPQFKCIVGLTKWMDLRVLTQAVYNRFEGVSSLFFGDFHFGFDFQLYNSNASRWFPGVKLGIIEIFPVGKYQRLSAEKKGTDATGFGSYTTNILVAFHKVYHLNGAHYLSTELSIQYLMPSDVAVHGINVYGGGLKTHGTVDPGNILLTIFSFEYTFTNHWAFALDAIYRHKNKDSFSGRKGVMVETGDEAIIENPSSEQFNFTPGIEYNFNVNLGIIATAWFSAFGRNTGQFRGGIISCSYLF